jgi:thiamine biosynthesis lipoprotein
LLDSKASRKTKLLTNNELALNLIESAALTRLTVRHEFFAMGTRFHFIAVNPPKDAFAILEARTRELESKWTRFNANSELMQVNFAQGREHNISPEVALLISEMINGYQLTDGSFNPSVLPALTRRGFVTEDQSINEHATVSEMQTGNLNDIAFDDDRQAVKLPVGMMLDAGGIGKGLAADILAEQAIVLGAGGIAVFAGGEVAVRGQAPTAGGWTIGIQNPWDSEDLLDIVELSRGGIATSSSEARTTNFGHHLIDPHSDLSFVTDIVQATVLCDRATDAEVLTKACFAHNHVDALAMVEEAGAQTLLVTADGVIHRSHKWEDFT